jgi:hypothetical protein
MPADPPVSRALFIVELNASIADCRESQMALRGSRELQTQKLELSVMRYR